MVFALAGVLNLVCTFRPCLQGGRVTLASGLTLAGGQKIARVYKQNFTGRVTLQPGTTSCAVTLKGSGNNRKLTRVGGLTLPGVFTREKVNPLARITLARR